MTLPWGDPDKIAITYQFTDIIVSEIAVIEKNIGCSISKAIETEAGRRQLIEEIYNKAKCFVVEGYSPEKEIPYILGKLLDAASVEKDAMILFYKDGVFNDL